MELHVFPRKELTSVRRVITLFLNITNILQIVSRESQRELVGTDVGDWGQGIDLSRGSRESIYVQFG